MAELIPIPFPSLLKRIYYEYEKNNSIFDLPARKFYRPSNEVDMSVSFCRNPASNPVGPAAGPQTQLAQNIVLSWLAGSRILELKTVQIKDRLELTRPCIDMATIGYNTEWSQELRLEESLREYVKASMIVEILQKAFQVSGFKFQDKPEACDVKLETIFDISVGYDLAGIQSPQIRQWLQTMRNASVLVEEYRKEIPSEFASYRDVQFKTEIANSITLSTFHGTPADEIERICEFLLTEMDYHVIIKMNPPMLGRERIEGLLHEKLGYTDVEVNGKIYEVNITFQDAVDVVRRLQTVADQRGKTIGVKFGNTLEVINKGKFLKDKIQYLSGQPLHILHLALVDEWRKVFGAEFPISFSAGVDANNFADCVAIGLVPITTCTDLLRPGGYGRLPQYLYNLEGRMKEIGARTIEEYIVKFGNQNLKSRTNPKSQISNLKSAILNNTSNLLEESLNNLRYHYQQNKKPPRKIGSHLYLWDCINCDKCIPVCPNDANFFFEVEPVEIQYKNIEIVNTTWREIEGGIFKIEEKHQIATFADACNECGNCDVFCPEDGGPYIEKPRFFSSWDSWQRWKTLSGFFLTKENDCVVLYGRFKEKEYRLVLKDQEQARFYWDSCSLILDWKTDQVLGIEPKSNSENIVVDMAYYITMKTLLKGMAETTRVHFVNVGVTI
ncbi:MAG: 4Fe-4S dicluster domain-containing protein [Ignavibacteriae bacterium]|nr:4Fe-4S dicluster domain-containing protein [Ignavibacteriota bacterium]